MYKVRFTVKFPGFRKVSLYGYYIPPEPQPSVPEMKKDCEKFLRSEILRQYDNSDNTDIELVEFRQVPFNFIHVAKRS